MTVHTWLTIAAASFAPLPYGSTDPFWIGAWVLVLAAALAIAPLGAFNRAQERALCWMICLWLTYSAIAALQILPNPPLLAHEAWLQAKELLGAAPSPRISARDSIPLDALGRTLLAILAFCNGFIVGARQQEARRLLDWVAYAGATVALYAVAAELAAPSHLLFRSKTAYLGDMTGTFVNRNTAATFFAVISTLWLFAILRKAARIHLYVGGLMLIVPQHEAAARSLALRIMALSISAIALLGTHSRGGVLAFAFGLATCAAIVLLEKGKTLLLAALAALVTIIYRHGGTIVSRVESEGLSDGGRWTTYRSSLKLVVEHPWLGTGLGTFEDVFPMVRGNGAFTSGVWDKAHNTVVEIAVEMGLPMAASVVIAASWILYSTYRAALESEGRRRADLLALSCIAVTAFAHSLMDFSMQIPGFLAPFAILLGVASALSLQTKDEAVRRQKSAA
ncbi:O-antigen ligase [Methylosinus sp. Ce-a6]|uniref:O-antigen ligase family protein n=1 Tax=Methylosinus sp. Ce-a6 TaxID=2172005 RepID=UPI0013583765|nr:O-antigen ligase family protein [Methylosinus sp. Ce-a6]